MVSVGVSGLAGRPALMVATGDQRPAPRLFTARTRTWYSVPFTSSEMSTAVVALLWPVSFHCPPPVR